MRAVLCLALVLGVNASAAETWQLTWKAPAGCLTAAELALKVEERLGHAVFGLHGVRHIEGVVRSVSEPPRWRAHLATVDERGTVVGSREVNADGEDCHSLDTALVLVLAITIGDNAEWPVEAAPPPPPPPLPQAQPTPPEPARVVQSLRPVRRWFGDGGIGLAAQTQLVSPFSPGVAASVRPSLSEGLFLDFRAGVYPYTPLASGGATSGAVTGSLSMLLGGRLTPSARWSFGLAVGAMGTGFLLENRALGGGLQVRGRFDVEARLHAQLRLETWGVEVGVEVGYAPVPTFLRIVTAGGLPRDLELAGWHVGGSLMVIWPMGDGRPRTASY